MISLPSIPDVIASFHPNKALFQISIALLSAFKVTFIIVYCLTVSKKDPKLGKILLLVGFGRLLSMLSFSFITVEDDLSANVNSLALYSLFTLLWIYMISRRVQSRQTQVNILRKKLSSYYVLGIIGTIIFLYKHQIERMTYAFSLSSLFQWSLLILDLRFDSTLTIDMRDIVIAVNLGKEFELSKKLDKHLV